MVQGEKEPINYQIELLTEEQIPQAATAFMIAFNEADVGEKWDQRSAEEYVKHCWKKQPDLFLIAIEGGEIIGGVVGEIKPWWNGPHLTETEIFVHPEHQKKGVAKFLLKRILEVAIEKYGIKDFEGIADGARHGFPMNWYNKIGMERSGWVHIWGNPQEILRKLSE